MITIEKKELANVNKQIEKEQFPISNLNLTIIIIFSIVGMIFAVLVAYVYFLRNKLIRL